MDTTTGYARNGDLHLATYVHGTGERDLVLVPGFVGHHEKGLEFPPYRAFFEELASFARVITFDRRGTGQSDRPADLGTIEDQVDDLRAVLDAVGSSRATLLGISEGGPMSVLFTATHPDRVAQLILFGAYARMARAPDYPDGWTREELAKSFETMVDRWGEGAGVNRFAPSLAEENRAWWASFEREATSPGHIKSVLEVAGAIDVRDILPMVRVPTLVLSRAGDVIVPIAMGRYLADHIEGARFVELPGSDHLPMGDGAERLVAELREFVTGERRGPERDRVLGTVLFTDIVGSTERAAELGDAAWRHLLEQHHRIVRDRIREFRGREIKTTGDGFLAMFDGPTRAIRCARETADAVRTLDLQIRAGLHTGECEIMGEDIGGIAVHIASRVAGLAGSGEVLVSRTVKDLSAGSGLAYDDRGVHTLKGIPDEWQLYAVRE